MAVSQRECNALELGRDFKSGHSGSSVALCSTPAGASGDHGRGVRCKARPLLGAWVEAPPVPEMGGAAYVSGNGTTPARIIAGGGWFAVRTSSA
jgi:hypothetical protein